MVRKLRQQFRDQARAPLGAGVEKFQRALLLAPFGIWFLFFIVAPMAVLLIMSFSHRTELGETQIAFEWTAYRTLLNPLYGKVLFTTLLFAAANTVVTLLAAYPFSYFMYRCKPSARLWVITLILVPFWTSFLVRILAFVDVLRLHPFGFDWIYKAPGILSAMVYNYLPFAVLPIFASMEKIHYSLIEAAKDLGAGRVQVLTRILWPLTRSGVSVAALFVFVPSLGEFLIPELVGGGNYFLLGSFLQNQFLTARNWPLGAATIMIVVIGTLIVLPLFNGVAKAKGAAT
ncbi:MAG: ABC transporter permease [Methylotenera sp.]|nr:ABC transporter permease [Oligoflexia bacterium]